MRFYSFLTAENNDKIESSEVEPEPENPKVYIDAPPPKENPWLKNKPQLSEPEGKVSLYFGNIITMFLALVDYKLLQLA